MLTPNTNPYKASYTNNVSSSSLNDISTRSLFTVSIGEESGKSATGSNNVFVGYRTGFHTLETYNSVFIGSHTGFNTTAGDGNVFIGARCATNVTDSSFNTIAGYNSAINMKKGEYNTVFGYDTISQSDTLSYNTVFGTSCGKNMDQSTYNVIVGTNTTNNMSFGDCNIYIGTQNEPIKPNSDNSLVLGNFNTVDDDSITVGSMNSSSTKNCISIGTKIKSQSVSTITDPLTQYDPLIINTAKQRLNINSIEVVPQENNLIYTPLAIISPPHKLSTRNDVDVITKTYTVRTTSIPSEHITLTRTIARSDNVDPDSMNILYNITFPVISASQIYSTSIPISSLPIDTVHADIQILVVEQPKYGYVTKTLYNLDDTITINQYPEFRLLKNDKIQITTVQYGFVSPERFNIFFNRNVPDISIPIQYFNSYIHPRYFYNNNNTILLEDGTSTTDIYYPTQQKFIINDLELYSNTLPTYEHSSVDIVYIITLLPSSVSINPIIPNETGIYIETPPTHGVVSSNSYMSINNFEYFIKTPSITMDDSMQIRFMSNNKLSEKSYNVIIKNYLVHLDTIYLNNIDYPITQSLIDNGYFWRDGVLQHNNRQYIYIDDNTLSIDLPLYPVVELNTITITCLPFNSVSLHDYFNLNIFVISQPSHGYIKDGIYQNTRNINDQFRIVLTINTYIGFEEHVVDVQIDIQNTFNITTSTQYIDDGTVNNASLTIHVDGIENSNVKMYDKNMNYISSLDELIVFESGIEEYYVIFGDVLEATPVDIYPLIVHAVRTDYYYEADIPNSISSINSIKYMFSDAPLTEFDIEFVFRAEPYLIDIDYNMFMFKLIVGDYTFLFRENGIYIEGHTVGIYNMFEYNTSYLINVKYDGLYVNSVLMYSNSITNIDKIQLYYNLDDNLINRLSLINYTVPVFITNLTISTSLDTDGQNVLIGRDMISSGIDNICIGKDFNTFGNNSIIIGNDIGSSQQLLFDNGIHDSIVIGNNNFQKSLAKNIIAIGNDIYEDFYISTQTDYQKASRYFSSNPIIIGNELEYDATHVVNIGNKIIIKEDDNVVIGNIDIKKEFAKLYAEIDVLKSALSL